MTLARTAAAEAIGTALLLAIVVGSGIMGERLAQGNAAVALLANSLATGAGLYALIGMFGPISGAHFNPVVSAISALQGRLGKRDCAVYVLAQVGGAFVGVLIAHSMFSLPLIEVSGHVRPSGVNAPTPRTNTRRTQVTSTDPDIQIARYSRRFERYCSRSGPGRLFEGLRSSMTVTSSRPRRSRTSR